MFPILPFVYAVTVFGIGSWGLNKVLEKVTGRTLEGNLDAGSEKVVEFVRPKPYDQIDYPADIP